jgi:hypothetical protein
VNISSRSRYSSGTDETLPRHEHLDLAIVKLNDATTIESPIIEYQFRFTLPLLELLFEEFASILITILIGYYAEQEQGLIQIRFGRQYTETVSSTTSSNLPEYRPAASAQQGPSAAAEDAHAQSERSSVDEEEQEVDIISEYFPAPAELPITERAAVQSPLRQRNIRHLPSLD